MVTGIPSLMPFGSPVLSQVYCFRSLISRIFNKLSYRYIVSAVSKKKKKKLITVPVYYTDAALDVETCHFLCGFFIDCISAANDLVSQMTWNE